MKRCKESEAEMSKEKWTLQEIEKYKQVIKLAPKSRARAEVRRERKLDKLFNRLHGKRVKG